MAEAKTVPSKQSVAQFIHAIESEKKRHDAKVVLAMMRKISELKPKMWGASIIGFGSRHYKYESGREGDSPLLCFSPRKQNLVFYVLTGSKKQGDLLKKLGKHKVGRACLYVNKLDDVDLKVLEKIFIESFEDSKAKHCD